MKSKKLVQFENSFNAIELDKIFEIEVIDKRTNEKDYIICDIEIQGTKLVAQRIGVTLKEEKSKFIATTKIVIDPDFSVDENLQELYSAIISDIIDSEFFELPND